MPYKQPVIEKYYYNIGEVADIFEINPSNLRYWEKEFPQINPHKNARGVRMYTKDDIEEIRLIYHLIKEKGLTIKGAKDKLKQNKKDTIDQFEIIKRLQNARQMLLDIKKEL